MKAIEKLLKIGKYEGTHRYVMQACWDVAVQITCYDHKGNEVKRLTSAGCYAIFFPLTTWG